MAYQPMTIAGLAGHLSRHHDEKVKWKHGVYLSAREFSITPASG